MKAIKRIGTFKTLVLCMVLVALMGTLSGCGGKQDTTAVRESVAALKIYVVTENGEEVELGWGSCFFVGKPGEKVKYLVTNHHVVKNYLLAGAGDWEKLELGNEYISQVITGKLIMHVCFDSKDEVEAYVVDYDEKKDIALLELENPTDQRKALALSVPTNDMAGKPISIVGYPGTSENEFMDAVSSWGKEDASITTGTVSRLVTTSGTGVKSIQTDAVIQHGNSGGPMVNEKNSVIGISVSSVTQVNGGNVADMEKVYYAVNVDQLIPMLDLHDVDYVLENNFPIAILIIILAVVVVIVVVVLIIVLSKKSGKGKKEKKKAAGNADAQVAPAAPNVNPVVRSMSVQHNGATYPLNGQQILIGRDTQSCAIVYQTGTPGISGRHCSVAWDGAAGDFVIVDLKSSYGTYLANGQRLNPGVPYHIKAGEQFYLGENSNMISVELR